MTIPHCIPADPLVTLWQSNGGMGNPLVLVGKTSMWENPLLYHAWLPYKVLHFQRPPWALLSPRQLSLTGLASQYDWSTQKRPWAKSGCLWFGGTCMDSWWFKITSEKDEGNSYKKFPQLLKKDNGFTVLCDVIGMMIYIWNIPKWLNLFSYFQDSDWL